MKSLMNRLATSFGAAAIVLSVPLMANADFLSPTKLDLDAAIANIVGNTTKLLALTSVKDTDVKIVNVEDIASGNGLIDIQNTLNNAFVKLQLVTLHNTLNDVDVLSGNGDSQTLTNFLNGNDVDVSDVVGVNVLQGGKVLVWECSSCD